MNIARLRTRIDEIDMNILALLSERARMALEIGHEKQKQGLAVLNTEREVEILDRLSKANQGPLEDEKIRAIFAAVIDACRSLQSGE